MQSKWLTVLLTKHGKKKYRLLYSGNALLKIQIMAVEFGEELHLSRGRGYGKIATIGESISDYMIFHELSVIPTCNDEGISVEISHLHHHKLCVKPQHLVLETHVIKMDRLHCKNQGFCFRGHQPHCLIVSQC